MVCSSSLGNLDGDSADGSRIEVGAGGLDDVVIADVGNGEGVRLGAPGAIPVDPADLGFVVEELEAAFGAAGGVGATAGRYVVRVLG